MMYYILHKNGKLIGVSPFIESTQLNLDGVSIITLEGSIPDLNSVVWNEETLELVAVKKVFTPVDFLSRFTVTERINISSSSDLVVKDIMKLFDSSIEINIEDSRTIQAMEYLAYVGILTQSRVVEILNA